MGRNAISLSNIEDESIIDEKKKKEYVTKQECNLSIDSDKSTSTSSVDLRDSISFLNTDDVNNQKKYVIQQKHNASIDKSNSLYSTYLVDAISLSNIEDEPIIDEKKQRKYVTKQENNLSIDSDKSNSTSSVDLRDSISLLNIDNLNNQKEICDTAKT